MPQGGKVAAGRALIGKPDKNGLTITQSSAQAIIDWNSFSIGLGQTVDFVLPSTGSATLNRVSGSMNSVIAGTLRSNGELFLINPNGIEITPTGQINTESFTASALAITDDDFLSGKYIFRGNNSSANVSNAGAIAVASGGSVALLGGKVNDSGSITAPGGRVGLGAGESISVDLEGDQFLSVSVPSANIPLLQSLVSQSGHSRTAGGRVALRAASTADVARAAIQVSGVTSADTASASADGVDFGRNPLATANVGSVAIDGGAGGQVEITGRISVTSAIGQGGAVSVAGGDIVLKGATLDASGATGGGQILIGGDAQGQGPMPHAVTTTVDAASTLTADATQGGNGGHVVLWSDQATEFDGTISALGGLQGGNGGLVETSSHGRLNVLGLAHANGRSASGHAGEWLMDPADITISTAADSNMNESGTPWTASGQPGNVSTTTIDTALNAGTSVNITTNSGTGTGGSGNVTVNAPIVQSAGAGGATLTLAAYKNLTVNSSISSTSGPLNIVLSAATGGVFDNGASLLTNGGNLTISAPAAGSANAITLTSATINVGAGTGSITGTTTSGVGMTLSGTNSLTATGTGSITASGTSNGSTNGLQLAASAALTTSGTVSLSGTSSTGTALAFLGSNTVTDSSGTLSLLGNKMTLAGTLNGTGASSLILAPTTASTSIGIGAGQSGTLNFSAAALATLQPGFGSITIGSPSGTGAVNVGSWTANAPLTIQSPAGAGTIALNGALATGSGTSAGSISVLAGTSITGASGASIVTQGQPVTLTGFVAGSGSGGVSLNADTITTNGGNLTVTGTATGTNTGLSLTSDTVNVGAGTGTLSGTSPGGFGTILSGTTSLTAATGGSLTVNGTTTTSSGVGGAAGLNIAAATALTTAGTVTLSGSGSANGAAHGLTLLSSVAVTSSGSLTLQGSTGGNNRNGLIFNAGDSLTATSGNLAVTGTNTGTTSGNGLGITQGGALTLNNNGAGTFTVTAANYSGSGNGFNMSSAATITTSGAISLSGASTGSAGFNFSGSNTLTDTSGTLQVTGSSTSSQGVFFTGADSLTNSGAGSLILSATSSTYSAFQLANNASLNTSGGISLSGTSGSLYGLYLQGANSITDSAGNLTIAANSTSSYGVWLNSGTNSLTSSGSGTLSIGGTSGSNYGVALNSTNSTKLTTAGAVSLTGNSTSNTGVSLLGSNTLTVSGGSLALGGTSGSGDGIDFANTTIAGAGNLTINGTSTSTSGSHYGVNLSGSDSITANSGNLALTGTDSSGGIGILAATLSLANAGTGSFSVTGSGGGIKLTAPVSTSGSVGVTGNATTTAGTGILFNSGATITSAGTLTLGGTSAATNSNRYGIEFLGSNALTATSGNLTMTGTGTAGAPGIYLNAGSLALSNNGGGDFSVSGSGVSSAGLQVANTGAVTTSGNMTLSGTSTGYTGAYFSGSTGSLTDSSGNLTLSGTEPNVNAGMQFRGSVTLTNSGSGTLSVVASSGSYRGLDLFAGSSLTLAGAIAVNATSSSGSGISFSGDNNLTVASGPVSLTGTASTGVGVRFLISSSDTLTGAFTLSGVSATGSGVSLDTPVGLTTAGNIMISGQSTGGSGFVSSGNDVLTVSSGSLTLVGNTASAGMLGFDWSSSGNSITNNGTGRLTLNGTGGNTFAASIASPNAPLVITDTGTVTQSGGAITAGSLLLSGSGAFTLGGANQVGTLAANVGSLAFNNDQDLILGAVQGTTGISSAGSLTVTAAGSLSIAPGAQIAGAAPVLSATGAFINAGGAAAVNSSSGNWLIYSSNPSADTFGNLDSQNTAVWNATYAANPPNTISTGANRYLFAYQPIVTVTTTDASKTYGADVTNAIASNYTLAGIQSGMTNAFLGDTLASVISGTPSITSPGAAGAATVAGGPYAINAAQGSLSASLGYALAYQSSGNLSVTPAALTVTASNQSKTYGTTFDLGSTAFTETGLVNSDTLTGITLASPGTAATATVSGAPYVISPSNAVGAGLSNYSISYVNGALAVTPAALTVTASNQSKTYGTTVDLGTTAFTESGLMNSDTVTNVALDSPGAPATAAVSGGPYAITPTNASGAGLGNYTITYKTGILTVNPAPLVGMITAANKIYDGTTAALLTSQSLRGQTYGSDGSNLSLSVGSSAFNSPNALDATTVTATDLSLVGSAASNYYLVSPTASATAAILPRPITVAAVGTSQIYGNMTPPLTYSVGGMGLIGSDKLSGALATSAGPAAHVGSYAITDGTLAASPNYAVNYIGATLQIDPRPLTVVAVPQSIIYGAPLPALIYTVGGAGLVNGDRLSGSLATTANATANGGAYPITQGSLAASNDYVLSFTGASLTVSGPQSPTAAELAAISYEDALPGLAHDAAVSQMTIENLVDRSGHCSATTSEAARSGMAIGVFALEALVDATRRCKGAWSRTDDTIDWWKLAAGRIQISSP